MQTMKLTKLGALLRGYFTLGANTTSFPSSIVNLPAGMTGDNSALFGMAAFPGNIDSIDEDMVAVVGSTSVAIVLTAAQMAGTNWIDYSGSPAGAVTITFPTAAQLISGFPSTIPLNGYNFKCRFINDGSGQTVTLTTATGVTLIGTMTIANNNYRDVLICINVNSGTVNVVNCGGGAL